MVKKVKLSPTMTEAQFENGYWYVSDLKGFAKNTGFPQASVKPKKWHQT